MTAVKVRVSLELFNHLSTFEWDGTTVAATLFEGDRLCYPGRKDIEHELGYAEPYVLPLEARVIQGLGRRCEAAIRYLSAIATEAHLGHDLTLDLLWASHRAFMQEHRDQVALDRIIAALVTIEAFREHQIVEPMVVQASEFFVKTLHSVGLPPTKESLEEIFDGAEPACLGLGLVEL